MNLNHIQIQLVQISGKLFMNHLQKLLKNHKKEINKRWKLRMIQMNKNLWHLKELLIKKIQKCVDKLYKLNYNNYQN